MGLESLSMYLFFSGVRVRSTSDWRKLGLGVQSISIPDNGEEIGDMCFVVCRSVSRVTIRQRSK